MTEPNMIEQAFAQQQEIVPIGDVSSSAETGELIKAFVAMQADLQGAEQTGWDPTHGRGRSYANINDVLNAIREPMAQHGLAVMQFPVASGDGRLAMTSRIVHVSGQWLQTPTLIATVVDFRGNPSMNIQALGSAVTYLRRYQLKPLVGLSDEDDDGNSAAGNGVPEKKTEPNAELCPECGKPLQLRTGKKGPFYGCTGYPNCKYTRDATTPAMTPATTPPAAAPPAKENVEPGKRNAWAKLLQLAREYGLDAAALSVYVTALGKKNETATVEDIQAIADMLPSLAEEYRELKSLDANWRHPDGRHFLQLRTDERREALEGLRKETLPF